MMYYFSVVILLNRPFIVSGKNGNDNEATRCCTEAAKTIMDVARYVRVDDIMHFGHTAGELFRYLQVPTQICLIEHPTTASYDHYASVLHPPLQLC